MFETVGQHGFLGENFWRLTTLRTYSVILKLKALLQGPLKPGVPIKQSVPKFSNKNSSSFFIWYFAETFRLDFWLSSGEKFFSFCKFRDIFGVF